MSDFELPDSVRAYFEVIWNPGPTLAKLMS